MLQLVFTCAMVMCIQPSAATAESEGFFACRTITGETIELGELREKTVKCIKQVKCYFHHKSYIRKMTINDKSAKLYNAFDTAIQPIITFFNELTALQQCFNGHSGIQNPHQQPPLYNYDFDQVNTGNSLWYGGRMQDDTAMHSTAQANAIPATSSIDIYTKQLIESVKKNALISMEKLMKCYRSIELLLNERKSNQKHVMKALNALESHKERCAQMQSAIQHFEMNLESLINKLKIFEDKNYAISDELKRAVVKSTESEIKESQSILMDLKQSEKYNSYNMTIQEMYEQCRLKIIEYVEEAVHSAAKILTNTLDTYNVLLSSPDDQTQDLSFDMLAAAKLTGITVELKNKLDREVSEYSNNSKCENVTGVKRGSVFKRPPKQTSSSCLETTEELIRLLYSVEINAKVD